MDIKKMEEDLSKAQPLKVEAEAAPKKPKKPLTEKQKQALADGRQKGNLEKKERTEANKHGTSLKQNVNDLMKDIGDIKKTLKNEKKAETSDSIKLEKPQIPVLQEEKPKEPGSNEKNDPENTIPAPEDNSDFFNRYRVKRYTNIQQVKAGINMNGIIKPILGKKNNPFMK